MIAPTFKETLTQQQARMRLAQLRAVLVPAKSKPGRQVYWVAARNTWILISSIGEGRLVLGYYQMERCPCEDE